MFLASSFSDGEEFWTGGHWVWSDGSESGDCVGYSTGEQSHWVDHHCALKLPFVCKKSSLTSVSDAEDTDPDCYHSQIFWSVIGTLIVVTLILGKRN